MRDDLTRLLAMSAERDKLGAHCTVSHATVAALAAELEAARAVVEAARKPAVTGGHLLLCAAVGHYDALKNSAAKAGKAVE